MTASTATWRDYAGRSVLKLQVIVATMVVGCIVYLIIAAFFIGRQGPLHWQAAGVTTWIAVGLAACALAMRLAVVWFITLRARRAIVRGDFDARWKMEFEEGEEPPPPAGDARRFLVFLQTRTIIGAAICEGCAFFAIFSYIAEHNIVSLVVAVLSTLCVAIHLPTRWGTVRWIEDQLAWVERERSLQE